MALETVTINAVNAECHEERTMLLMRRLNAVDHDRGIRMSLIPRIG